MDYNSTISGSCITIANSTLFVNLENINHNDVGHNKVLIMSNKSCSSLSNLTINYYNKPSFICQVNLQKETEDITINLLSCATSNGSLTIIVIVIILALVVIVAAVLIIAFKTNLKEYIFVSTAMRKELREKQGRQKDRKIKEVQHKLSNLQSDLKDLQESHEKVEKMLQSARSKLDSEDNDNDNE